MADQNVLLEHAYLSIGGSLNADLMADQLEVEVDSSLNQPDMCRVIVHDTKLKWIDAPSIALGTELKVSSKAESGATGDLFVGEIATIEPDFKAGEQRVHIIAFDKLHRLTRGRKSRTYLNMSDSDIVSKIASENGMTADAESAGGPHKYVYQHNQSDLEFLRTRAARVGFVVYMSDGKLCFKKPKADGAVIEVKWGDDLLIFSPRQSSVNQVSKVIVRGWDPVKKESVKGQVESSGDGQPEIGESKAGGKASDGAYGITTEFVDTDMPIPTQERADKLAQARMDELTTDYITGTGEIKGNPKVIAGVKIKVGNIGQRFSGEYTVTSATHVFDKSKSGYTTRVSFSGHHIESVTAALKDDRTNLGERLAIGIVTNNDDPDKMGRVKVRFPWHAPDIESNWARVVTPGAGKDRGVQFIPEVNDEVLLGFDLGDVDNPYILGGLWNGQDTLAKTQSDVVKGGKIEQRVIRSRTGHTITFDDKDGAGGVYIEDRSGNLLHLETQSNKMVVKTQGNIEIETQADMTIKATGKISIEATQEIDLKASTGITIDGGAKVDVKGVMVNIN